MSAPSFHGRRVLAFESRRAKEIEALITTFGGRPIVAPAVREIPNESDEATIAFARALVRGSFDGVVFLTGAGVRAIVEVVDRAGLRVAFVAALSRVKVMARGPKPLAALRDLGVPVWTSAPEPSTWRELVAAVDARSGEWALAGQRVAVQEYGAPNPELVEALRARGAEVTAIQAYRWAMPDDLEPLRAAARALAGGEIDVVLVTSGVQIAHFWRVAGEIGLEAEVRRALPRVVIASIGPSASAELRARGIEPTFEPSHPKMGLLVREAAGRV